MKRVALALTFLVIGGILGVAFSNFASPYFKPKFPEKLGVPPAEATKISPVTASSVATVEPESAPVPRVPSPPPPPQVASVPDTPLPAVVPTPPPPAKEAKPAIKQASEKAGEKEAR